MTDKRKSQEQGGKDTGTQRSANLGQKEAEQERKSEAEIKRMGEGKDKD